MFMHRRPDYTSRSYKGRRGRSRRCAVALFEYASLHDFRDALCLFHPCSQFFSHSRRTISCFSLPSLSSYIQCINHWRRDASWRPGQTVELPLHSSRAAAATTLIIHHACCVWFMNTIRHHATRHAQWIRQKTSPLGAYYQFAPRASHRRGLLLRTSDIAWSARLSVRVLDRTHR